MKNLKLIILSSIWWFLAYKLIEKEYKDKKIQSSLSKLWEETYKEYQIFLKKVREIKQKYNIWS